MEADGMEQFSVKTNGFGKTGVRVTCVGLGGEGVLRTTGRADEARSVIQSAISSGITYYDCARVYSDSELYYGSIWREDRNTRAGIFQASKSAGRDKKSAKKDLDETLGRLNLEYIDLWQIHDVRTETDMMQIEDPGGALEAFEEAKKEGKVRFIGVTGHHDPDILTKAVNRWPVDSVMMPVNPVEAILGGFLTQTLPAATSKGIAVIGMKILGAGHYVAPHLGATPERLIRFALDQGISVAIVGCSSSEEAAALAAAGAEKKPFTESERSQLMGVFTPDARKLAFYRKGWQ